MEITAPGRSEWGAFLELAGQEGWRVTPAEVSLFRQGRIGRGFVVRDKGGVAGFVTAVPHNSSGWIGNLLVPAARRGAGLGGQLFDHALTWLHRRGVDTVWLTASELGRPMVTSASFRAAAKAPLESLGFHKLRGVSDPQEVFAPPA